MAVDSADKRRHLRHRVKEFCHARLEGCECGVAVEFLFHPADDRTLIARLWRVLNDYTSDPKPA